jgi:hypothetical protein
MCSSPGGGNNAPQFAGTTELEDSGAVWCNGAVVLNLFFFGWSQNAQSCANCSCCPVLVHSIRCGGSFPALFLLLAVLGAAMAGAALASLFYRLANPQPIVQVEVC